MNEAIYIQMPVPATSGRRAHNCSGIACTKQDCKDYGPNICFVCSLFIGALIGLIIFLVRTN